MKTWTRQGQIHGGMPVLHRGVLAVHPRRQTDFKTRFLGSKKPKQALAPPGKSVV